MDVHAEVDPRKQGLKLALDHVAIFVRSPHAEVDPRKQGLKLQQLYGVSIVLGGYTRRGRSKKTRIETGIWDISQ